MKKTLCFLLLLDIAHMASGQGTDVIGRRDTVGGTTWDLQFNGPTPRTVDYDPGYGIHAVWTNSTDLRGSFPDRSARYNFYDPIRREWVFNENPDFMEWGARVLVQRNLLGNLDVNPITHTAYISATTSAGPVVARDQIPGGGMFETSDGPSGYIWPLISLCHSQKVHVAMSDVATYGNLYYSGIRPGDTWSTPFHIPPPMPDPDYPYYMVAASKRGTKVCIVWADCRHEPRRFFYRKSTDDGVTWLPPDTLPLPPAFTPGSDTLVSGIDLYPWYDPDEDEEDALHLVGSFVPVVGESTLAMPAEIWHWRENSGWNSIARAGCAPEHLAGELETAAVYAERPTLSFDATRHQLICVWEQFDSGNAEPLTGKLRADIWAARGDSTGGHWGPPVRLTTPDNTSKRFPCAANRVYCDTLPVMYEVDLVAGFGVPPFSEGPITANPIVMQWVPVAQIPPPSMAGLGDVRSVSLALRASPNPVTNRTRISYSLSRAEAVQLVVTDAAGRIAARLEQGIRRPGAYSVTWNGRDEQGNLLPAGCYFCALKAGNRAALAKIILTR